MRPAAAAAGPGAGVTKPEKVSSTNPKVLSAHFRKACLTKHTALARLTSPSVVKSEGCGWEPPRASVSALSAEVRFAADIDGGMAAVR